MTSINDATPMDWDAIKADRYTDNRPFAEPECVLPADHREMMKRERDPKGVPYAPDPDPVNAPSHYRVAEIEAIDYISGQLGSGVKNYLEGNILKYMHRWRYKNGVEDLRKAKWYLDKLIFEEVQGG